MLILIKIDVKKTTMSKSTILTVLLFSGSSSDRRPQATVTAFGGLTLQRHPTRDQLLPEGNAVPVCTLVPTHGRIERCLPSWRPAPVPAGVGTVCLKHVGPARVSTRSIVMRRVGGLLASHRTVLPAITWRRMVCGVRNSSSTTASLGVNKSLW